VSVRRSAFTPIYGSNNPFTVLSSRETVEYVRQVESAGVDFIAVHGRLKNQRSSTPPNLDAIALVKSTVQCPVVANGDVYSLKDVKMIVAATKVDGNSFVG